MDPASCAFTQEELKELAQRFKPWQIQPPVAKQPTPAPPKTVDEIICSRKPTRPLGLDQTVKKDSLGLFWEGKRADLHVLEEDLKLSSSEESFAPASNSSSATNWSELAETIEKNI
jgi:hypothetical protein